MIMGLHNFIRISNYLDKYFAYIMTYTGIDNVNSMVEQSYTEKEKIRQRKLITNIREIIINMLRTNKNTLY